MKLSVLDQSPVSDGNTAKEALAASIELAMLADDFGYTRYWVAEHHDMPGLACPAPDIMIGMIGSQTTNIRIGAGAVLLPHYKPFNVAERYNLLASLFPGRVDLGIGRAPGGSAEVTMALSDNFLESVRKMPALLDELLSFFNRNFPKDHMYAKITPSPVPPISADPWLLGTSEKSAILAADKGLSYAFGHFMSEKDGPSIVKKYKDRRIKNSNVLIALSVICADTTEEAEELALSGQLWKTLQAKGEGQHGVPSIEEAKAYAYTAEESAQISMMRKKMIIGNPTEVKQQMLALQADYQADEMMIVTITHSYEARKRSYELIANQFG